MKTTFHLFPRWLHSIFFAGLLTLASPAFAQVDEEFFLEDIEQEKPVFKKHYNEPPWIKRKEIDDKQVKAWKADDDFWYADKEFRKNFSTTTKTYLPIGRTPWFQTILWILILGGFVGVLIWFLSENRVGLFSRKANISGSSQEDEIPEDIFAINYQKEIDQAIRTENYRLAVRLMFLRLLKTFSENNLINYKQEKTNLDYLFEVQPTAHYNSFFRIVRNYEYSWYGLFPVSREAFDIIKKDFELLEKQLYRH